MFNAHMKLSNVSFTRRWHYMASLHHCIYLLNICICLLNSFCSCRRICRCLLSFVGGMRAKSKESNKTTKRHAHRTRNETQLCGMCDPQFSTAECGILIPMDKLWIKQSRLWLLQNIPLCTSYSRKWCSYLSVVVQICRILYWILGGEERETKFLNKQR